MKHAVLVPLAAGALGLALGCVEVAIDPRRAIFAYAAGFTIALTVALGALLFVMIAYMSGAHWFVVLRRLTEAIALTLPIFPVLFLPIAFGVRTLYPWAGPVGDLDRAQQAWAAHAHSWLNVPFFIFRSYVYLAVWSVLSLLLCNGGHSEHANGARNRRKLTVSAVGIPIMALTLTFAAFDWLMPLDARWTSDMLGVYLFAGSFAGAIGATAVVAWLAWRAKILPAAVGPAHFHALGRVLLVTVIFWGYIGFCQFLLVWIADMARESSFYVDRAHGGWAWASATLVVAHFVVPFFLLLSRPLKRQASALAFVGAWILCAHALDVYWLVVPSLHAGMRWLDLGFLVGVSGISASYGARRFLAGEPVPIDDAALEESLRYASP